MAASVNVCEKADICRLFALFYHALGCHSVEGAMSSRSCIVPRTLILFLIAFLFLGKFQLISLNGGISFALVCRGGVSMTPNFTLPPPRFLITRVMYECRVVESVLCGMSRELPLTALLTHQLLNHNYNANTNTNTSANTNANTKYKYDEDLVLL